MQDRGPRGPGLESPDPQSMVETYTKCSGSRVSAVWITSFSSPLEVTIGSFSWDIPEGLSCTLLSAMQRDLVFLYNFISPASQWIKWKEVKLLLFIHLLFLPFTGLGCTLQQRFILQWYLQMFWFTFVCHCHCLFWQHISWTYSSICFIFKFVFKVNLPSQVHTTHLPNKRLVLTLTTRWQCGNMKHGFLLWKVKVT